ncbi:11658_t:CDS:2 [Dentiscutata erythropus]|uniref:histidinol-phosphate transaminase n=1 Tax=Dentiscutata erythropus TaxID=1348616 RepID=A0A9N9E5R8_9GLOM|nr:11658_t:CDS:2 [Dentiscutata erythropus]
MSKSFSLESIVRPNILSLTPYRCARDDYGSGILLDANENSFGSILQEDESLLVKDLHRYPDPNQVLIKERLVSFRGLQSIDYLFLGVGSDEIIDLVIRIFCVPGKDKILITPPTYGMYSVCANINDVQVIKVNLDVDDGKFQLKPDKISEALSENPSPKIVFLCSPGNPTSTCLSHNTIKAVLDDPNLKGVVVIDEAYIDFTEETEGASVAKWVEKYPNLIVMQTLSKSFGLAGIRLGICIADPKIIRLMNNTKAPYNINSLTSHTALNALSLQNITKMRETVRQIRAEREKLISSITSITGIGKLLGANNANFILVQILDEACEKPSNERAHWIYKELAENQGIVVRFRGKEFGCEGCLRITVGTPQENEILLEKLKHLLGGTTVKST